MRSPSIRGRGSSSGSIRSAAKRPGWGSSRRAVAALALCGLLGAGAAAAEPPYDPTAPPPGLAPGADQPSRAPWEQAPEAEEAEPSAGLQMVLHRSATAYRGERRALINGEPRVVGDQWEAARISRIRRYGIDLEHEDTTEYVPVVRHGVEKTRRRPEEPPRVKGQ